MEKSIKKEFDNMEFEVLHMFEAGTITLRDFNKRIDNFINFKKSLITNTIFEIVDID